MAMLCRRGNIRGGEIGAIEVQRTSSIVQIDRRVAHAFGAATRESDPRDPRIQIRPLQAAARERVTPDSTDRAFAPSRQQRRMPFPRAKVIPSTQGGVVPPKRRRHPQ
jgi:ATP-dependent RNA helicase DeaD